MTYSRKRYWLALGAAVAVAVAIPAIWVPHSAGTMVLPALAITAICGALGFLAYFSQDEIQRQREMRSWYFGGLLAILFGLVPFLLFMPNALLQWLAGFVPHPSAAAAGNLEAEKAYLNFGVMAALMAQAIGHFIAHFIFKIAGRAR